LSQIASNLNLITTNSSVNVTGKWNFYESNLKNLENSLKDYAKIYLTLAEKFNFTGLELLKPSIDNLTNFVRPLANVDHFTIDTKPANLSMLIGKYFNLLKIQMEAKLNFTVGWTFAEVVYGEMLNANIDNDELYDLLDAYYSIDDSFYYYLMDVSDALVKIVTSIISVTAILPTQPPADLPCGTFLSFDPIEDPSAPRCFGYFAGMDWNWNNLLVGTGKIGTVRIFLSRLNILRIF
jgi:hypothetical protein